MPAVWGRKFFHRAPECRSDSREGVAGLGRNRDYHQALGAQLPEIIMSGTEFELFAMPSACRVWGTTLSW
jgi:hypothetical protein